MHLVLSHGLVWTTCLMHRCVCIWRYILQNYNYKLHFQNLSIYHILHVSIRTLTAENLDVCIAYDLWDSNIPWEKTGDSKYMLGLLLILISKSWGCPLMPSLDSDTCPERGGYLFLSGFSSLYDAIHGWMTRWMDGWKLHEKQPRHPLLYVMSMIKTNNQHLSWFNSLLNSHYTRNDFLKSNKDYETLANSIKQGVCHSVALPFTF